MRRRHAMLPGFSGHYQDLGIASLSGMILIDLFEDLFWQVTCLGIPQATRGTHKVCPIDISMELQNIACQNEFSKRSIRAQAATTPSLVIPRSRCVRARSQLMFTRFAF